VLLIHVQGGTETSELLFTEYSDTKLTFDDIFECQILCTFTAESDGKKTSENTASVGKIVVKSTLLFFGLQLLMNDSF